MSSVDEETLGPWRQWDLCEWNQALCRYYFGTSSGTGPVRRLLVTYDELARATGIEDANANDVRQRLLALINLELTGRGRSILASAHSLARELGWTPADVTPPPYVFHLLMTCLAASDTEGDLVNEGNFRSRLGELTGWSDTQNMTALPELWEELVVWLDTRIEAGADYSPLILPDRGWEKLIGYSKGLAFPGVRDQTLLVRLLAEADLLGSEPPIPEVLQLVLKNIHRFSLSFRQAFESMRNRYLSGAPVADEAVWSAVRDAALRDPASFVTSKRLSDWIVVAEMEDGSMLPLVLGRHPWTRGEFTTTSATGSGEHRHMLKSVRRAKDPDEYSAAFRQVVEGDVVNGAPELREVRRAAAEGLFLFAAVPGEAFELVFRKPDATSVWVLIRDELAPHLLEVARPHYKRASAAPSHLTGWTEIRGLDGYNFAALDFSGVEQLADVRSLQDVARPPVLRMVDGLRLQGGRHFLGIRGALPVVTIDGAESVVRKTVQGDVQLEKVNDRTWQFPGDWEPDDGSDCELEAVLAAGVVRTTVRFDNRIVACGYKWPNDPHRWRCEGSTQASVTLEAHPECGLQTFTSQEVTLDWGAYLAPSLGLGPIPGEIRATADGCDWRLLHWPETSEWELTWTGGEAPREWDGDHVGTRAAKTAWHKWISNADVAPKFAERRSDYVRRGRVHPSPPARDDVPDERDQAEWEFNGTEEITGRVANLERALAATACRRNGVSERDILDLFRSLLGVWDWRLIWDIVRAWREVGALVRATDMRWRRSTFFAVAPRLVQFHAGRRVGVSLMGLTTASLRSQFARRVQELGGTLRKRKSVSPYVPCPPGAFLESLDVVGELSASLAAHGVEPAAWLRPLGELVGPVEGAAEKMREIPSNYPIHSTWDWDNGRFDAAEEPHVANGIRVDHYRRPDASDFWAVTDADCGDVYWWSYSRMWSLLVGYWIADDFSFKPLGDRALARNVKAGVYLPIGVGNLLAVVSPLMPGPRNRSNRSEDGYDYVYTFPTDALRTAVLQRLGQVVGLREQPKTKVVQTHVVRTELTLDAPQERSSSLMGLLQLTALLEEQGLPSPSPLPDMPEVVAWEDAGVAVGIALDQSSLNQLVALGLEAHSYDGIGPTEEFIKSLRERLQ